MIAREQVYSWFYNLKSYEKVDFLSGLSRLLTTPECKFLNIILMDTYKAAYHEFDRIINIIQMLSNDRYAIDNLLIYDETRRDILLSLSLALHESPLDTSHSIFNFLMHQSKNDILKRLFERDETVRDEILTIFTLAANHPFFDYESRAILQTELSKWHSFLHQVLTHEREGLKAHRFLRGGDISMEISSPVTTKIITDVKWCNNILKQMDNILINFTVSFSNSSLSTNVSKKFVDIGEFIAQTIGCDFQTFHGYETLPIHFETIDKMRHHLTTFCNIAVHKKYQHAVCNFLFPEASSNGLNNKKGHKFNKPPSSIKSAGNNIINDTTININNPDLSSLPRKHNSSVNLTASSDNATAMNSNNNSSLNQYLVKHNLDSFLKDVKESDLISVISNFNNNNSEATTTSSDKNFLVDRILDVKFTSEDFANFENLCRDYVNQLKVEDWVIMSENGSRQKPLDSDNGANYSSKGTNSLNGQSEDYSCVNFQEDYDDDDEEEEEGQQRKQQNVDNSSDGEETHDVTITEPCEDERVNMDGSLLSFAPNNLIAQSNNLNSSAASLNGEMSSKDKAVGSSVVNSNAMSSALHINSHPAQNMPPVNSNNNNNNMLHINYAMALFNTYIQNFFLLLQCNSYNQEFNGSFFPQLRHSSYPIQNNLTNGSVYAAVASAATGATSPSAMMLFNNPPPQFNNHQQNRQLNGGGGGRSFHNNRNSNNSSSASLSVSTLHDSMKRNNSNNNINKNKSTAQTNGPSFSQQQQLQQQQQQCYSFLPTQTTGFAASTSSTCFNPLPGLDQRILNNNHNQELTNFSNQPNQHQPPIRSINKERAKIVCYNCGAVGHLRQNCPQSLFPL